MPNHNALAIANKFAHKCSATIPQMKLQKLVYIAHGWNLAVNKEPLIFDRIEAWDGGPVIRTIWNHIRDKGYDIQNRFFSNPFNNQAWDATLLDKEIGIIDHVWTKYGSYSGSDLSNMTHQEGTPWSNAYFGRGRNAVLLDNDIEQHFIELGMAGRADR